MPLHGHPSGAQVGQNKFFTGGGNLGGVGVGRTVTSKILSTPASGGLPTVRVAFGVTFVSGSGTFITAEDETPLFTREHTVTFIESGRRFRLAPDAGISAEDMTALYDIASEKLGPAEFLTLNIDALKQIATGTDAKKKNWLRHFLDGSQESAEKSILVDALH